MRALATLALVAMLCLAACKSKSGQGPCPAGKVRDYLSIDDRYALEAVGEICDYPDHLSEMFQELAAAPPDYRFIAVASTLAENPALIGGFCSGGPRAIAQMAQVAPAEAAQVLVDGCKLDDLGLASREQLLVADKTQLLVAALLFGWMKSEGVGEKQAQKVCRKILRSR